MAHTLLIRLVYSEEKDVQWCCLDWTKHLQCFEAFFISHVQYSLKHLTDPRMKTYSSEAQSRLFAVCIPPIYNLDNKPNMVCREGSASAIQPWMFQCQSDIHVIYYAHGGGRGVQTLLKEDIVLDRKSLTCLLSSALLVIQLVCYLC